MATHINRHIRTGSQYFVRACAVTDIVIVLPPEFECNDFRICDYPSRVNCMNHPAHNNKGGNERTKKSASGLDRQGKIFTSAGEALDAYIDEFEGRRTASYRRRPSDLISPKPKYYFMDSLERSLKGSASRSPAQKVDELLEWVNDTYAKDISSQVLPFGFKTTTELPGSG